MTQANLKLIKTLWGIDDPISPTLFQSIQEEGYHGVEVIRFAWMTNDAKEILIQSLNDASLKCVCQIHTAGGYLQDGEYVYCGAYTVEEHKKDFVKQILECVELISQVRQGGLINVHAGVDAWSDEEARDFLEWCIGELDDMIPPSLTIPVTFETHRQRLFGSPFQTQRLLSIPSLTKLRLNADLSHWYCACERVFDVAEERDAPWWPTLLSNLAQRCDYIHARFGWSQGPQMADPAAEECEPERLLQMEVWRVLLQQQIMGPSTGSGTGTGSRRSSAEVLVCPEYGPIPYMAVMPHTQKFVASLPDAVAYTKKVIEELFHSINESK